MAASVGGVSCTFVHNNVPGTRARVETWQTPGQDGYGAQQLGAGDTPYQVQAVKYGAYSATRTWQGSIEALAGTIVTIIDDWGTSYTNCIVQEIGQVQRRPAGTPQADPNDTECRCEIIIRGVRTT